MRAGEEEVVLPGTAGGKLGCAAGALPALASSAFHFVLAPASRLCSYPWFRTLRWWFTSPPRRSMLETCLAFLNLFSVEEVVATTGQGEQKTCRH